MRTLFIVIFLGVATLTPSKADSVRWQSVPFVLYNKGELLAAVNFSTNPIRSGIFNSTNPNPDVIVNQVPFQTAAASPGAVSGHYYELAAADGQVAGGGIVSYASARNLYGLVHDTVLTVPGSPGFRMNLRNLQTSRLYRANFIFSSALPKVNAYFSQASADADPNGYDSFVFGSTTGPGALDVEFYPDSSTKTFELFANSPQRPLTLAGFTLFDITDANPPPAQQGIAPEMIIGQVMEGSFPDATKAICLDPASGKLFVSSATAILRFSSMSKFQTGAAPEIKLSAKSDSLAVDASGSLWAVQTTDHRVVRFANAADRTMATPDGYLGLSTRAPGAGRQGFKNPKAVAADVSGTLWVADYGNNRVLGFANAHAKVDGAEADYLLGQPTWDNVGSGVAPTRMNSPAALASGPGNTLWVADGGTRILRFDNPSLTSPGGAAQGVLGHADFFGTLPVNTAARFRANSISCTAEGRLYVRELTSGMLRFDLAAAKANGAAPDGTFSLPSPFPVNSTIYSFTTGNEDQGWFGGEIAGGRFVVARLADLSRQSGSTVETSVLGDFTLQRVSSKKAQKITGIGMDPASGKIFAVDQPNHRVLRFGAGSSLHSGDAAEAVFGQPDFTSNLPGTSATTMRDPSLCTVDALGNLWVSDSGNRRVLKFSGAAQAQSGKAADGVLGQSSLTSSSVLPQSGFSIALPGPLVSDADGRLWVADVNSDGSRILRFDHAVSLPNGAGASGVLGRVDFYDTGPGGPDALKNLSDVAVDPQGTLWVADGATVSRLLRFDHPGLKGNGAPADRTTRINLPALVGADTPYSHSAPFAYAPSLTFHADGRLLLAFAAGSHSFATGTSNYQLFLVSLAQPRNLPETISGRVPYATSKVIKVGDPHAFTLLSQRPTDLVFSGPNQFFLSLNTSYFTRYTFPERSYTQWLQAGGYPPHPGADQDQDGLASLMEYYLGGNAGVPDAGRLPSMGKQSVVVGGVPQNRWTLTFTCLAGIDDVTPFVETSTDLASGGWEQDAPLHSVTPAGTGSERRVYLLPDVSPRLMARLRLELKQ